MPNKNLIIYETNLPNFLKLGSGNIPSEVNLISISISDLENFDLIKIKKLSSLPIVVSCVLKINGGDFIGTKEEQIQIYNYLLGSGIDYLEIEFRLISLVDLSLKHNHTKIIVSDINLFKTPGYRNLRKIAKQMSVSKPYFYKFKYHLQTEKDATNLLRFLISKSKKQKFIIQTTGLNSTDFNQELLKFGAVASYL